MKTLRRYRTSLGGFMTALVAVWQIASPMNLNAASFYWDIDGAIAGAGGLVVSGNWNTTTGTNWSMDSTGTSATAAWTGTAADTAIFSAGTNATGSSTITINQGGSITLGGLTVQEGNVTIAANSALDKLDFTGAAFGSGLVNVAFLSKLTIGAEITGSSGLTKTGNGNLTLTNNSNSYTGDTVINGGSLVISNQAQLGTSTNTISINGIAGTGNPGYSGGQLVVQGGIAGVTITREISILGRGPGAVNSSGGLVSVGNNTFNGDILVAGPASGGRITATHGTTTLSGLVTIGLGADTLLYGNGNFVINGQVTGFEVSNDRFIKSGNLIGTTLVLANSNNNFLQSVRIDSGTVRVSTNTALGLNVSTQAVDLLNGILEVRTETPGVGNADFSTRKVFNRDNVNSGIFVDHAVGGSAINQTVTFGETRMTGGNTNVRITGRNGFNTTFTGVGNSALGNMGTGGANNALIENNSNGLLTMATANLWNQTNTTVRTLTIQGNGDSLLTGNIIASGAAHNFTKGGTGTLTVQGTASTYTGITTINAGTLSIGDVGAVAGTSQINIGNATTTSGALTYTGGAATLSKNILLNTTSANVFINASGTGALTLNGAITAVAGTKTLVLGGTNTADNTIASALPLGGTTLNIQKTGAGTWVLSGANAFTGSTTVSNGILKIQDTFSGTSRDVLPNAGAIIFGVDASTNTAGGTFQYLGDGANASTETVDALTATAGHGVVQVTPGSGGTATLTFASLARAAGATLNVLNTGTVNVTGTAGFLNAGTFFNGSDFAFSGAGTTLRAALYGDGLGGGGTDAGFVTSAVGLTAALHNEITGSFATNTLAINSLKINGTNTLTLNALQTLTVGVAAGSGIIQTGGSGIITGGTALATSAAGNDLAVRVEGGANTLTIATAITTSTAGLTKSGAGTLVLSGANTYSGTVNVNEGTLQMATGGLLGATNIGLTVRQGATFDLNGINVGTAASGTNSVNAFNGAGTVTNSSGTLATLRIGNSTANGYFSGLITGNLALVKAGTGTIHLSGTNTFTGPVTLVAGNLDVTRLANIGVASGIGMGDATNATTNAASLVFNGGSLRYVGTNGAGAVEATQTPSVSIDRLFTLAGSGTIASFGSYGNTVATRAANHASLIFNNTGAVAFSGAGTRTLTLRGDSQGDNLINLQLINNPNLNEALTLIKDDTGLWILGNSSNSYSGPTVITAGQLRAEGTALSTNSNLRLNGGVFETSGTFTRSIGTGAGQVFWTDAAGTAVNRNGGFAASTDRLTVNLGGMGGTLSWGTGGIGNGTGSLILSSTTALFDVDVVNGIDLNVTSGTVNRVITVNDNTSTGLDYATLSGVISNSGAGTGGIIKNGGGTLILGNANTYNGNTSLSDGTLIISSIGNSSGTTSSSVGASGGILQFNGNATSNLIYMGSGETSSRAVSITTALTAARTYRLDSSGSGALVLDNFTNSRTGSFTLLFELRGQNTDANRINSVIADGAAGGGFNIVKADGGVWILGNTANTFTGGVRADGGLLGLVSNGSLGAVGSLAPTTAVSTASTTVTVADTTALRVGMWVNGNGVAYGDYITGITNATQFTISTARTIASGVTLQFGGLTMSNGGIFAADPVAGLTLSQPIFFNNNTTNVFAGSGNITLDGAFQVGTGNNVGNFSNNLENGAILTINSNFINYKANDQTFSFVGYGDTVWNGVIQNATNGTNTTALTFAMGSTTSFTLAGGSANTYTGLTTLTNGILKLGKVGALGTGTFAFNGGTLQATTDLTGANKITNALQINNTPLIVSGSQSIEFGSATATTMGASRLLINNLDAGKTLTFSSNITNSAAATLTIAGTGDTLISGQVTTGTGAQGLAYSGTGTLTLTGANNATGVLTVNRGITTLSGANGAWTAGSFALNAGGTLRLDNSVNENATRMFDTGAVAMNGGTLDFIVDANGTSETASALTLGGSVMSKITMNGTGAAPGVLTFASVATPNTGSSLDLTGIANLGTDNKIIFTAPPTLTSGINTRFMIAGDFATYNGTNGVLAYAAYNNSNNLNTAANTDTMNLTANAVLSSSRTLNALKINGTGLNISSTGNKVLLLSAAGILNTGGNNTLSISQINFGGGTGYIQVDSGTALDMQSTLINGALNKTGAGILTLSAQNFYNSTTNITGGTLKLAGGLNTIFPGVQQITIGVGATLDLNGNTQYVGALTGAGSLPGTSGNVTSSTGTGTIVINGNSTLGGQITGSVNVGKIGNNTITLESANAYTGATVLIGGTTALENDATILNTSSIDINYATLTLNNNSSLQTQNNNRIGDSIGITMRGGNLTYNGRLSTAATETFGAMTLAQGANTITANTGGGTITSADITFASLTRAAGTTVNFTGTSLGAPGNNARILFTAPLTTVGKGVLGAWAIANSTDYAAYNSTNGVGVVGSGGFAGYDTTFASGNITNLGSSTVALTTTLTAATTNTGLLRLQGAFTNDLAFTGGSDVLNLQLGGILRSNNNNATSIGTAAIRGIITSGTSELVVYNAANTTGATVMTINSIIQGATSLIKSGAGVLSLTAQNTYSLGTVVNQGTLELRGTTAGDVVLPSGGLTLNSSIVTMFTNAGQINSTNTVTLNGSSTFTMVGNNTLNSLVFNNNGGTTAPTVNVGDVLTLSNAAPITVTTANAATTATITGGYLALSSGANTLSIGAPTLAGQVYTTIASSLTINSIITGTGSITKTGNGLFQLGAQNTFTGGMNVQGGGIILAANSTSTVPSGNLISGPLGSGTVSFANGTTLLVDNNSRTVANAMTFAGNPTFNNTGVTLSTLTLNGALNFNTLTTTGLVVNIPTPFLNVVLGGPITNIGSVTSIGSGAGANTITKTGLGNITGLNLTGISSSATINIGGITNTSTFSLLHDGDGTGSLETINIGAITWEPASGTVLALTIGRAGAGVNFATAVNKTIAPASITSSLLGNGLTLTNGNNYGLLVADNIVFNTVSAGQGPTFNVSAASTSLQATGLTLSGQLTGGPTGATALVFTKSGAGVLALTNATNSFGGTGSIIDITGGYLAANSDGALGNASNVVRINTNSATQGFRATGTFATSRSFVLNGAANNGIEVTKGNTLTLNTGLTFTIPTTGLQKNDIGTLVLAASNATWTGLLTVSQGTVRITDSGALGTTALGAQINFAGGIELANNVTIADALLFNAGNNNTLRGIDGAGALRSVSGTNTWSGAITIAVTTADNNNRSGTITADSGSILNITGGVIGQVGTTGASRHSGIGFGGAGTINVATTGLTNTGTLGIYQLTKFGTGTLNLQVASAFSGRDVIIKQGTLSMNGAGTFGVLGGGQGATRTVFVNDLGTLTLDNVIGAAANNRLGNAALTIAGGNITILGDNAATTTETTTGAMTFNAGASVFTLDAGTGQQLNFTTAAVTRNAGSTLLIRADGFGSAAGANVATIQGSVATYTFTAGQLGATGTTNKSILAWAIGDTAIGGAGIGFVTADSAAAAVNAGTNRLRLLSGSEQSTTLVVNTNVNLTSAGNQASSLSINSLVLGSGGSVALSGGAVLTLDSGGLLALTGNSGISGVGSLSTAGNREMIIHAVADLNIGVAIGGFTGGLTKSGSGILTLAAGNTYTGTTTVNAGTLKLAASDFSLATNQTMQLLGGNLDLNGTVQNFNNLQGQTGGLAVNDFYAASYGGNVINTSATEATLALTTANVAFFGRIGNDTVGDSDIALVRSTAAGAIVDWNLSSNNTYTGATLFNGGRVQLVDEARLSGTSSIEISNATLLLGGSNTSYEPVSSTINRINDGAAITLRGAMFQGRGYAGNTYSETLGALIIGHGNSMIDIAEPGTGVNQIDYTFASLTQQAGSHGTVRFVNVDGNIPGLARTFFTAAPVLTNNLIGGWATFEREFASYTTGQGVGGLNGTGFAGYSPNLINSSLTTDNIRIALPTAGSTTTLTANRTINSLAMIDPTASIGNSALDLGGFTLTLGSGGLIVSPATENFGITVQNGNLTAGTAGVGGDLYLHALQWTNNQATDTGNRDVTVSANIINNAGGAVALVVEGNQGRGTQAATNDVFITGTNTYTGGTFVNAGRIVLNTAGANGSTITATGTGNLTITGGYSSNPAAFTDRNTQVILGASNQIANTATVTVMGGATFNLNNFNQTVGGLVFDNHGGDTPTVAIGSGILTLNGNVTATSQNLGAVSTISSTGTGALNLNGAVRTFNVSAVTWNSDILNRTLATLSISATIIGGASSGITKTSDGIMLLSGANTFTGPVTINGGTLKAGVASVANVSGAFGLNTAVTLANVAGATLDITGFNTQIGSLAGGGATAGNVTLGAAILTTGGDNTTTAFAGSISGTGGLTKIGSGIQTLSGTNIYSGATTVSSGTLNLTGSLTGNTAITVSGTGALTESAAGVISGTSSITHSSSGTSTLSGTNTYTGATTVTGGILRVNGSTVAASAVNVSGGAIGGTGTINGAVTISSIGGINLEDGVVGTLALGSTLNITGATGANSLRFDLGMAAGGTDMITVVGNTTVTNAGAAVITLNQLGGVASPINAGTYNLIQGTGTMAALSQFALATTSAFGQTFSLAVVGNNLQLTSAAAAAGPAATFWAGGANNWSTVANWNTDATSGITASSAPGYQTNVTFYTTTPVAANLTTNVLDVDFDINSLNYSVDAIANTTIGGTKMLTIEATSANGNTAGNGITVNTPTSGTPTHTISSKVGLASSQTWTVATGGALVVSGVVSDFGGGYSLTKAGAGTLTLSGNNTYTGATIVSDGTLSIGGSGALADTAAVNVTGSAATLNISAITASETIGSLAGVSGSSVVLGAKNLTVGGNNTSTTFAGTITGVGGSLTKTGTGTMILSGLSTTAASNYTGTTTIDNGTLAITSNTALTGGLTLGAVAGGATASTLDLSTANATFNGATLVQTNTATPNTIIIGPAQTLQLNGAVTVGYNSAANSTTKLTATGGGTLNIGSLVTATNANVQIGNGQTTNISNAATVDLSGLSTFYANLGTGTFRIGDPTNAGGTAAAGSTLILASNSTITATTITSDSPSGVVTQAIKLGSGTNILNANTIEIGGAINRGVGTLDFNGSSGTLKVRALDTTGQATMNVQNGASGIIAGLVGTVNLNGHSSDLLLSTLTIGGRSAGTTGAGTGTFSFDTGILDATTVVIATRTGATMTTANITGTLNLMQTAGTTGSVTIGTLNMAINSATTATTNGRALATLNIGGNGTVGITTMTMVNNSIGGGATNQTANPANSTVNISGSTTTIGTLNMNVNSSANTGTGNASLSTLNISGGTVIIGPGGIDMANASVAAATATSTINLTGGTLTLGGNLTYTNGVGTENTTLTINGGTLDMGGFNIGSAATAVGSGTGALNFQSGTLRNVATINGTAGITKTTAGTLILEGTNSYTGATAVNAGTIIARSATALGNNSAGNNVTVALGAGLNYAATADAKLNVGGTLTITGGVGTVIGGSIGATGGAGVSSAQINVTGDATTTAAAVTVNIYGITGVSAASGTNTYTLVHGVGAGSAMNLATYTLGTIYNNTGFTVGALSSTAADLNVSITGTTALTAAFWRGGLTGATNVWAASSTTASNWVTSAAGGVTALVPGAGTDVTISATAVTTSPSPSILGADMSIKSLTIADTVNGLTLNADGNTLTIGTGGITVNSSVPASTIAAKVALGAGQIWTNNSANAFTVSGIISGANSLTKAGTGAVILTGANTYSGTTTVSAGNLQVGNLSVGQSGSGNVTVNGATAVLSGTGTVVGTTTVSLGTLRPGDAGGASVGALTFSNGLTYTGGSTELQISGALNTDSNRDRINVSGGTLTLSNASNIVVSFSGFTPLDNTAYSWNLLDWSVLSNPSGFSAGTNGRTGGLGGGNLDLADISGVVNASWDISQFLTSGVVSIVVVPEPSRMLLLMFGLMAIFFRRRRESVSR